ncbi:DUF6441 family protein [Methylocystis echinoides]|uniref:DUF6441 family protein n=1 Tax=Methylocystis echinoides TaxID=29468 RepID=UPI0034257122
MAPLTLSVDPKEIDAALDAEFKALSGRVRAATEKAGRATVLIPVRDATRQVLKSRKLPTTWRGQIQPKESKPTLSPAFFTWSKAPKIMAAFSEGATIAPTGGRRYLWIPTENVPVTSGGSRLKPAAVERKFKGFTFARARNGSLVALVMARQGSKRSKARGRPLKTTFRRATKKDPGKKVAMFILVRKVRLKKRLDVASIANAAGARFAVAYQKAANSQ